MTIVINFCSGPGSGKSTLAAELFVHMKKQGYIVEYLQEYAKKLTWTQRFDILNNQHIVSYKYYESIKAIADVPDIDFVILDSSLLNGLYYNRNNLDNLSNIDKTEKMILEYFRNFSNKTFFIKRGTGYEYKMHGRIQTENQAKAIDESLIKILEHHSIPFKVISIDNNPVENIMKELAISS